MWSFVLALTVLAPVAGGLLALTRWRRFGSTIASATTAATGIATAAALALLLHGPHRLAVTVGDVELGLAADRVTAFLALTTAAIGTTVLAFSARAMAGEPHQARFLAGSSLLVGATTLVAVAAGLPGVAVGWLAVSALVVWIVRMAGGERPARRIRRAQAVGDVAIAVAAVAAVAAGGAALGPTDTAQRWALGSLELPVVELIAVLLVLAGIARSALVPMHGWLGASLAGPTPLSALLHAGVVNGVGVLVIRTGPTIGASAVADWLLFAAGATTAVLATAMMLVRVDAKGALVWSTSGQMGFMAVQLAVGAVAAALFHLVGHAWFKAAAFLGVAGSVDAGTAAGHLPRPARTTGAATRFAVAAVLPAAAILATFAIVRPHGTDAALVVLAVFGWVTAARLVDGWLRGSAPGAATLAVAAGAAVVLPAAYVSLVAAFERLVEPTLVAGGAITGVGLAPVLVVLTLTATLALFVRFAPGSIGLRARRRLLALLVGLSSPPAPARPAPAAARSVPSTLPIPAHAGTHP